MVLYSKMWLFLLELTSPDFIHIQVLKSIELPRIVSCILKDSQRGFAQAWWFRDLGSPGYAAAPPRHPVSLVFEMKVTEDRGHLQPRTQLRINFNRVFVFENRATSNRGLPQRRTQFRIKFNRKFVFENRATSNRGLPQRGTQCRIKFNRMFVFENRTT